MDMTKTIAPKSTQLNADDLIGGKHLTITITKVTEGPGKDQPVEIHYAGGLPYLPCKSMRRALIHLWGPDGAKYVGRSLTLFCDPNVKFGGQEVGGIRLSHASHIDKPVTMQLTATKGKRSPFTVQPLVMGPTLADTIAEIEKAATLDALKTVVSKAGKAFTDDESRAAITAAKDKRKAELTPKENPMEGVK